MMNSTSEESDIQFNLCFLNCPSENIDRLLTDPIVFDHLLRAARNPILRFNRSYEREEADRVTDIDELSSIITFTSTTSNKESRMIPIEIITNERQEMTTPIEVIKNKIEEVTTPVQTKPEIPSAPPLPPTLNYAIKLQAQSMQAAVRSPDPETLWSSVRIHYTF